MPQDQICNSEFDMVDQMNRVTGVEVPRPLAELKNKEVRFNNVSAVEDMPGYVLKALGIN